MSVQAQDATKTTSKAAVVSVTAFPILIALSFSHLLNDMMQSLVPAIYPIIKDAYHLDFGQIGLITLTFQISASLLQPIVGMYTDRNPKPYSLVAGMGFTLVGLFVLAYAASYPFLLLGAGLIGTGSSIFHPESTRMARLASGGRHGFAQSLFQVGRQTGAALGPLLAAFIIVPHGQASLAWFSVAAFVAMLVMQRVGSWYKEQLKSIARTVSAGARSREGRQTGVGLAVIVLVVLMFSKSAYSASLTSYYTLYLIDHFKVSIQTSQYLLFLFLVSGAIGNLIGGHLGDVIGRRKIIWFSILGALPFTLALPYVGLVGTAVLTVIIGMIMASAFPAILVYAIELLPGRIGMIGGLFYGLSFGLGGISAAMLGEIADWTSIDAVYAACAYLPLIGLLTWFLPDIRTERGAAH
jgi:FSR family fosmidomycin resistance protein-like MFS transporter